MQAPPQLGEHALRVLRVILANKVVRGADLMRRSGLRDPGELHSAVKQLLDNDLIEVTGNVFDVSAIPLATFGFRPSELRYLQMVAQQKPAT